MNIAILFFSALFLSTSLYSAEPTPYKEDSTISEFRELMAIAPSERTKDQKEKVRNIWRSSAKVRSFFHEASVLKVGDSVFDFPGVIQGRDIRYDGAKKEYHLKADYSVESGEGGNDYWAVDVIFSEDGIVIDERRRKMNTR